jgi:hypothetical protein
MRTFPFVVVALACLALSPLDAAPPPGAPDALDDALAGAGLVRADLGWRAKGWWAGYPDVPQKLRHTDDLFAEPLATIPFARTLGAGVRDLLDPAKAREKGPRGAGWLYRATHLLGVDRRMGAFRSYSANLTAESTPLADAVLAVYERAGRSTRFVTFGQESPYPAIVKEVRERCAVLPPEVSGVLGRLVLDLLDAQRWADRAWRGVPMELRAAVGRRLDLGAEEVDALDYEPAIDDLLARWDEASLWYAGMKTVEALDRARHDLEPLLLVAGAGLKEVGFELTTPLGRISILGSGLNTFTSGDAFDWLVVDLGGDDVWTGRVAATDAEHALAAVLDMGGDDGWHAIEPHPGRTQGAGVTGVAVLLDAAGNDRYLAGGSLVQGAGQCGLGALIDLGGDDVYDAGYSAQGAGYFGVGLLFDVAGNDRYRLRSDGQGFGGAGGVGTLADRSGDDVYEAVVDGAASGRPSYHTDGKVAVSNAQGCSMGRRGDGADGHSWAGGLGALLDASGNDTYTAGNWAQGCGYWFGTGLLWEGGGDDRYKANGWAQGSGAHFCVGVLVDAAGADAYEVTQGWGPAYGHDFTVGILADEVGHDAYVAGESGLGWSINRSIALLLDGGGDDRYELATPQKQVGTAVFDARFLDRAGPSRYWTETVSVGVLVDADGDDAYPAGFDDGQARTDAPGSENVRARNRGIAFDRAGGRIDFERPGAR